MRGFEGRNVGFLWVFDFAGLCVGIAVILEDIGIYFVRDDFFLEGIG